MYFIYFKKTILQTTNNTKRRKRKKYPQCTVYLLSRAEWKKWKYKKWMRWTLNCYHLKLTSNNLYFHLIIIREYIKRVYIFIYKYISINKNKLRALLFFTWVLLWMNTMIHTFSVAYTYKTNINLLFLYFFYHYTHLSLNLSNIINPNKSHK